jgi:hypothetical protein
LVGSTETELVAAQLDEIAQTHAEEPWRVLRDAFIAWHLRELATARAETWVPGMAGSRDPIVEEALSRFYRHHVRAAMERLHAENNELRRKLMAAVECARFYAGDASDSGARASATLCALLAPPRSCGRAEERETPPPWRARSEARMGQRRRPMI